MNKILNAPLHIKAALAVLIVAFLTMVVVAPVVLVVLIVTTIIMHCVFLVISYFS